MGIINRVHSLVGMGAVILEGKEIREISCELNRLNALVDMLQTAIDRAAAAHETLRKENREYLTEIINWKEEARLAHERGTGTTAKAG